MNGPPRNVVVVPCFNEAARLDVPAFRALVDGGMTAALFVDDGSTDTTGAVLAELAGTSTSVDVLTLDRNRGKGEAVRLGLLHALDAGAVTVGYLDADLSTPTAGYLGLLRALDDDLALQMVLGSRVALLGTHIERRARRHYLGRVFGTLASTSLAMPVYDTQCGAKAFRASPALRAALQAPFQSRWVFDVELIGRLRTGSPGHPGLPLEAFREVPLEAWRDVPGGTLGAAQMTQALADLVRIAWHRERARRAGHR